MIKKAQIEDWTENPVTLELKRLSELEIAQAVMKKGIDAFHPFQPQRTQEVLAGLNGIHETWEYMVGFLEGDWSYFETEEDSEGEESDEE